MTRRRALAAVYAAGGVATYAGITAITRDTFPPRVRAAMAALWPLAAVAGAGSLATEELVDHDANGARLLLVPVAVAGFAAAVPLLWVAEWLDRLEARHG